MKACGFSAYIPALVFDWGTPCWSLMMVVTDFDWGTPCWSLIEALHAGWLRHSMLLEKDGALGKILCALSGWGFGPWSKAACWWRQGGTHPQPLPQGSKRAFFPVPCWLSPPSSPSRTRSQKQLWQARWRATCSSREWGRRSTRCQPSSSTAWTCPALARKASRLSSRKAWMWTSRAPRCVRVCLRVCALARARVCLWKRQQVRALARAQVCVYVCVCTVCVCLMPRLWFSHACPPYALAPLLHPLPFCTPPFVHTLPLRSQRQGNPEGTDEGDSGGEEDDEDGGGNEEGRGGRAEAVQDKAPWIGLLAAQDYDALNGGLHLYACTYVRAWVRACACWAFYKAGRTGVLVIQVLSVFRDVNPRRLWEFWPSRRCGRR